MTKGVKGFQKGHTSFKGRGYKEIDPMSEARKSKVFKFWSVYYWFKLRLIVLIYKIFKVDLS